MQFGGLDPEPIKESDRQKADLGSNPSLNDADGEDHGALSALKSQVNENQDLIQ